jgi:hypothetical protein
MVHAPRPELKSWLNSIDGNDGTVAEIAVLLPLQMVVAVGVRTGTGGIASNPATVVAVLVHVPLEAVKVYTPAKAELILVIVGLSDVDVKPEGPAHENVPPATVPVRVTVPPGQTGELAAATTVTGHGIHRYTWPLAGLGSPTDQLPITTEGVAPELVSTL